MPGGVTDNQTAPPSHRTSKHRNLRLRVRENYPGGLLSGNDTYMNGRLNFKVHGSKGLRFCGLAMHFSRNFEENSLGMSASEHSCQVEANV